MTDHRGGLSRDSLIVVVVVCGAVAVLILLCFLLRARRSGATPLPPIQPLAHHREQLAPPPNLGPHSSRSSLLPNQSRPSSFLPVSTDDVTLSPPLPSRSFQDLTSSSFLSSDTDLPSTPPHSSPRRTRPLSTSSLTAAGTLISRPASRHTLRGVPHASYNQIQIVLPAPLAPSVYRRASLKGILTDPERLGAVDRWVSVGSVSGSPSHTTSRPFRRASSPPPLPLSSFPHHSSTPTALSLYPSSHQSEAITTPAR